MDVSIRMFKEKDSQTYYEHLKNEGDYEIYTRRFPTEENIKSTAAFAGNSHCFVFADEEDNMIGILCYYTPDEPEVYEHFPKSVEVGYYVFQPYRNMGLATWGVETFIDMLKKKTDCETVIIGCSPENIPSLRLIQSLGFTLYCETEDPSVPEIARKNLTHFLKIR